MTTDQLLKLIDAGFTADEIRGLIKPEAPEPETPEPETPEPETPEPETPEPETPEPEKEQPLTADDVRKIVSEQLKAAKQAANRRTADRGDEKPLTAEDVIRQLAKRL